MKDNNKKVDTTPKGQEELSDDDLKVVSGGSMRDKVYVKPTQDISEDTKDKI